MCHIRLPTLQHLSRSSRHLLFYRSDQHLRIFCSFLKTRQSILMWNIESKASKMDFDALASMTYPDVSPNKQVPFIPRSFAMPMIRPFIPVKLPLSIVEIFCSWNDFRISNESVAVQKIRGLSTNTPVIYAAKVKIFCVLNLAAISKVSLAKRYSDSPFAGWDSPVSIRKLVSEAREWLNKKYCFAWVLPSHSF